MFTTKQKWAAALLVAALLTSSALLRGQDRPTKQPASASNATASTVALPDVVAEDGLLLFLEGGAQLLRKEYRQADATLTRLCQHDPDDVLARTRLT